MLEIKKLQIYQNNLFLFNSQFVASPKCQWILNEIIYYEWPGWRDKSRLTKLAWFFCQLLLVAVSSVFYIPTRLVRKFSRCCNNEKIWEFRELYEHPYSKFINHTMWYLVFLSMIFLTSFDHKFETSTTGLIWRGKCHKFNFHSHRLGFFCSFDSPQSSFISSVLHLKF